MFYVEGGWVKEMTRKDGRGWEHAGTAGAIPDGQIAASVYVENGQSNVHFYIPAVSSPPFSRSSSKACLLYQQRRKDLQARLLGY